MHTQPTTAPSLDELNQSDMPAFLWDTGRRRVIWANSPGVRFFNADSLFDLIERRFGAADTGAARLSAMAEDISVGDARNEDLSFASANSGHSINCNCFGHHLPDGRIGVLVVAARTGVEKAAMGTGNKALDALPYGVLALSGDGVVTWCNAAARDLFAEDALDNLANVLGDEERAREAIGEVETAGVFSRVVRCATKFGQRDFRIHIQDLHTADDEVTTSNYLAMLEDVTERRALQQKLQEENQSLADYTAAVADFTWEVDGDLNFTHVSDGFEKATGVSQQEILGRNWQEVAAQYGLDAEGRIAAFFAEGLPWRETVDWTGAGDAGGVAPFVLSGVPTRSATGGRHGFRGVAVRSSTQAEPSQREESSADHWRAVEEHARAAYAGKAKQTPEPPSLPTKELPGQVEPDMQDTVVLDTADSAHESVSDEVESSAKELTEEEREAFRTLGETLSGDIKFVTVSKGETSPPVEEPAPEPVEPGEPETGTELVEADAEAADEVAREEEAERAGEIASSIIDGLQAALLVHRDGTLLHVNPFAATLLGYQSSEDALKAENLKRVFGVYAEDLVDPGKEITFTSVPLDSEPLRLKAYASTIAWPGGSAVQICLDTADGTPATAPAEAEEKETAKEPSPSVSSSLADDDLRAMLNTATDGIVTLDDNGTVLSLNASAEALFGYNSAELVGRPLGDVLAGNGSATVASYIADLTEGGIASAFNDGREVTGVEKNGGEIPMFLTLGPLPQKKGPEEDPSPRFCAVLRDLTTWKKTEADLRKSKDIAERANAQKSEFLANISHELRTPLNAIIGFSEVMKSRKFGDISNARYSGYINDIHASGEHLLSLINDLLDLSKIEAGKLELNFTSVRLEDVIAQCTALVQDHARDGRVLVRTSLQADLPDVVADQRAMRQIVLNLLSNAIKFTEPGGQVAISAKLDNSGEVRLKIKDTGRGMSAKELQRAMQPFMQVEEAGASEGTGTGLGLPLTKALTEANRAQFSISSEPAKGTLVTITFPVTRVLAD